jgi:hypothetical protein
MLKIHSTGGLQSYIHLFVFVALSSELQSKSLFDPSKSLAIGEKSDVVEGDEIRYGWTGKTLSLARGFLTSKQFT